MIAEINLYNVIASLSSHTASVGFPALLFPSPLGFKQQKNFLNEILDYGLYFFSLRCTFFNNSFFFLFSVFL